MSDSVEQRFTSLVQPHFAALHRAAMRLTRRRPDAEDLVQEVCLRACARLDDLGAVTNARAWLMRALYHLFVDATRRKRRRADVPLPGDEGAGVPYSEEPGPERAAEAHDALRPRMVSERCLSGASVHLSVTMPFCGSVDVFGTLNSTRSPQSSRCSSIIAN